MRRLRSQPGSRLGFTILELVLVVSVLSILAGAAVPQVLRHQRKARDTRRLDDVRTLLGAIEEFYIDQGRFPAADPGETVEGWDVSYDGRFLDELVREGYLRHTVLDPRNDAQWHYAYRVYGRNELGCEGGPFYVLAIRRFESESFRRGQRVFRCPDEDWSEQFDYVTGGGASFQ